MSTMTATRSKTYDIVYIGVFAVIMAICSWISIPTSRSVYPSDFWGIYCSRSTGRQKRFSCSPGVYYSWGNRCSGIFRNDRRRRYPCWDPQADIS